MASITSTWKFEHHGVRGFLSTNRGSTDALNALNEWVHRDPRRSFTDNRDAAEVDLVASLSTTLDDVNAGAELDAACAKWGVARVRQ